MGDLDDLAAAKSEARVYVPRRTGRAVRSSASAGDWPRPRGDDAGSAFKWGFFAGFGMWLSWLICSVVCFLLLCVLGAASCAGLYSNGRRTEVAQPAAPAAHRPTYNVFDP
jgi:hypothetical protein